MNILIMMEQATPPPLRVTAFGHCYTADLCVACLLACLGEDVICWVV